MVNKKKSMGSEPEFHWLGWLKARLTILAYVYFSWLFIWFLLRILFQDSWSWLFLVNGLAFYLFLPLPFVLALALLLRRPLIWLGLSGSLILWLALYGGLLLPNRSNVEVDGQTLTVMTYNAMGYIKDGMPAVDVMRNSGADIIGIGELNLILAEAIQKDLAEEYPYQVLHPVDGVEGNGVISRYPLSESEDRMPGGDWIGDPLVLSVDFGGTPVTVLQFHAVALWREPGTLGLEWSLRTREEQARIVAKFAGDSEGPIVLLSDLNATDQHEAYRLITSALSDSWREAGRGLGHTFPGANSRFSSRPVIFGVPAPKWMIRIDYIFHNEQLRTREAWLGAWDGLSDHRPVIARLALVSGNQ